MSDPTIIYLHGFLSSSNAHKAQLIQQYLNEQEETVRFLTPPLDDHPEKALEYLQAFIEELLPGKVCLIGSSLGGFYATWLAQYYGLRAVLLNPAVRPHELMARYLGENVNPYTDQSFILTEYDMQVLKNYYVAEVATPENLMVILQMADEVLDASEASRRFYQSRCIIEPGGNHQFEKFEQYIPMIKSWCCK